MITLKLLNGKSITFFSNDSPQKHISQAKRIIFMNYNTNDFKLLDENINQLIDLSKSSDTVKSITIAGIKDFDHLNEENAKLLVDGIGKNTNLSSICINGFILEDGAVSILAEMLKTNQTLKSFAINNIKISCTGIVTLVQGLLQNTTLKSFSIAGSNLDSIAINEIIHLIKNQRMLKVLKIFGNKIHPKDFKNLMNALKENNTITKIDLSNCGIGSIDSGAKLLADMLRHNQTLRSINITYNEINDEGLKAIADAFTDVINEDGKVISKGNRTLNCIEMGCSELKDEVTVNYLLEKVKHSVQLVFFDITGCFDKENNAVQEFHKFFHNKVKLLAQNIISAENYKDSPKVNIIADLAFNACYKIILDRVMSELQQETPKNARKLLKQLQEMYNPCLGITKSGDEGLWGMLPPEDSQKVISYILPPYKDTFREKEEVNNKVYATQSL